MKRPCPVPCPLRAKALSPVPRPLPHFNLRCTEPPTPPPPCQATPVSKQHQAVVLSILAPWILALRFVIGQVVCHVCCLVLWI